MTTLGERFARALAAKDFAQVTDLLHPEVDFRGMTPGRFWEATGPAQVIDEVLTSWFEDQDRIDAVVAWRPAAWSTATGSPGGSR
jgi:hypothetical protein